MAEVTSLRDTVSEKILAEYKQLYPESFINSVLKGCTWLATHNNITYQTSVSARGNELLFQDTVDYLQIKLLDKDNISSGTKTEYDILSVIETKDSSSAGTVFQVKTKYKTTSGLTLTLTPFLYYDPNAENPETYTQFQIDDKINILQAQIKELSNDGVLKDLTDEQLAAINSTATKDKIDSIVSKDNVYTKFEVDDKISNYADSIAKDYYTKEQVDKIHNEEIIANFYNKPQVNALLINKVDTTTLTANYTNNINLEEKLKLKADVTVVEDIVNQEETKIKALLSNIYTKEEVNSKLLQKVDTTTLTANYTNNSDLKKQLLEKLDKTEVDTLIETQNTRFQQLTDNIAATETKISESYDALNKAVTATKDEIYIKINDLTDSLTNASSEMTKQITALNTTITNNRKESLDKDQEHDTIINKFQNLISSTASETNKLVDKNYVDDLVKNNSANGISADVDGNGFASIEALKAGPWYLMGEVTTPSKNDYAVVKSDATHNGNDVRYNYDGSSWIFFQEFKTGSGSLDLTTNQQLAINSGITAEKVTKISTNETNIKLEAQNREEKDNELKQLITAEESTRLEKDNEILARVSKEETARSDGDLQLTNKIGEVEKAYVLADDTIKKLVNDNKLDIEKRVGSLTTLNTEVKTSIVDTINNVHDEIHNTRVAKEGDTMTGELKIQLPGSGSFLHMEAGGKGVSFSMDADLGSVNILPVSVPDAGFEISAVKFSPRSTNYPYSLGSNTTYWANAWITNINGTAVSDFLTTSNLTAITEQIATVTNLANTKVSKTGDTMTGTLKIESAGSGDLIHMEANGKGVTFTMDGEQGYMNIIPVSAPSLGFEVSAVALEPRTNTYPYRLGSTQNKWDTVWTTKINTINVSDLATNEQINALKTELASIPKFGKKADGSFVFTQVEYDNLTDAEKNNGKMYIIVN